MEVRVFLGAPILMAYKDKTVQREYQRLRYHKLRKKWFDENGPCVKCGSKDNLEVDHIDPLQKETHAVWSWSKERREKELIKYQVLCETCHKKKHEAAHGTTHRYYRCKCDLCRQANTNKVRKFRLAQ
jgi:5-methylcytosine-specific restriction endonuclease McrA